VAAKRGPGLSTSALLLGKSRTDGGFPLIGNRRSHEPPVRFPGSLFPCWHCGSLVVVAASEEDGTVSGCALQACELRRMVIAERWSLLDYDAR
jgi:hypothetical protein